MFINDCLGIARNAIVRIETNGIPIGVCEETGLPEYAETPDVFVGMSIEPIGDIGNQLMHKNNASERILEMRGTIYPQNIQDTEVLQRLYDAGNKTIYYQNSVIGNLWIEIVGEVQTLGSSLLTLSRNILGDPIVIRGRTQFKSCPFDDLPDDVKQALAGC